MTTVAISTCNVASYPEGGGHLWVYLQYALGLKELGCEVIWLEEFRPSNDQDHDRTKMETFHRRLGRFGLGDSTVLYARDAQSGSDNVKFLNSARWDKCVE